MPTNLVQTTFSQRRNERKIIFMIRNQLLEKCFGQYTCNYTLVKWQGNSSHREYCCFFICLVETDVIKWNLA